MPVPNSPPQAATSSAGPPRPHLDHLDGLRGLAALYVVLHHAFMEIDGTGNGAGLPLLVVRATRWLFYGQVAVDVFIVLSGYCLMLPIAWSAEGRLTGGLWGFLARRARRILPPYYAALALSLTAIALLPPLHRVQGVRWDVALPALRPGILLSHLLLLHNLSPAWEYKIDYPMWSIATEWQIYFFFPLLLLPLWRRGGSVALVLAAFALGAALDWCVPLALLHLLGLFALGMAAAAVTAPRRRAGRERLSPALYGAVAVVMAVLYVAFARSHRDWMWQHLLAMDAWVGAATAALLVYCALHLRAGHARVWPLRLLSAPVSVRLGVFSYSLYLIHAPVLAALHAVLRHFHLFPLRSFAILEAVGVPLSLVLAYLFHLAFERPFLPGRPRTEAQVARSAALSPAP